MRPSGADDNGIVLVLTFREAGSLLHGGQLSLMGVACQLGKFADVLGALLPKLRRTQAA